MKTAMKLRLIVLISLAGLISLQAEAQKKCKYDFEKEDPFTGEVSRGISTPVYPESPASNEFWYVGLNRTDDEFSVIIKLQLDGKRDEIVNAGDSVMFRTKSGSVVVSHTKEIYNPVYLEGKIWERSVPSTLYVAQYCITAEQVELLSKSPLTHIRMNISGEMFEAELKDKHGKAFHSAAACILQ